MQSSAKQIDKITYRIIKLHFELPIIYYDQPRTYSKNIFSENANICWPRFTWCTYYRHTKMYKIKSFRIWVHIATGKTLSAGKQTAEVF